ncbi:MAG: tetratricopeptide repeat protein [Chloroflexi bacterium]|nr:tetratricopeptide repeat protein [Chloroflexota bacterium]
MDEWTFRDEVKLSPIILPRAALQMACDIAYPNLNVPYYLLKIEELAMAAQQYICLENPIATQAEMLAEFLFQREGFSGNTDVYDDPRNSFLNEVIERRQGIPISLSVLYIAVARRLNIQAYGVGMPGHFIVKVPAGAKTVFFDPFNGGGRLSLADCVRLVRLTTSYSGPFQKDWLESVDNPSILTRMLNNLRLIYMEVQDWDYALRVIQQMQYLQPTSTDLLRELGIIHYRSGDINLAARYLNEYLRQEPQAKDAEMIKVGMEKALNHWASQN